MAAKYLPYFPKPLLDDLITGRWLPVIGAGLSHNAVVPPGKQMPLWDDLGTLLAGDLPDYPYTGSLDAISAYAHEYRRPKLVERLAELLLVDTAQPGRVHRAFCAIPFDIVCTTNFDFLLERQYDAMPRYCRPIIDESQLSVGSHGVDVTLLKIHGDLNHPDRLIVTESDYDGFLSDFPLLATFLSNLLITRTAVLIGYSLDDPDFRQLWHVVTERLGRLRRFAYAISVGARPMHVSRFERRGVKVINLPGTSFRYGEVLANAFEELREYIQDNIIGVSQVTEEEALRELSLPRDAATRLCFFAIPLTLHPFYREQVFPIAREAGFVPLTADDVVSPGDTIHAKISALIDRSALIVVEVSTPWTSVELRWALAKEKDGRILVVSPDASMLPSVLKETTEVLARPQVLTGDIESFLERVREWFTSSAEEIGQRISNEPIRLLDAREYRAAIIASITLLESWLRQKLIQMDALPRRSYSIRRMVEVAQQRGVIASSDLHDILEWLSIRNEVVHSPAKVSRERAQAIVYGVMHMIE